MSKYFGRLFRGLSFFASVDPGDLENGDIYLDESGLHKAKQSDTVIDLTTPRNMFIVRIATTTAGTLSTDFHNGSTIDSVTLNTGDLILIKDQSSGNENGIYTVQSSGTPVRRFDYSSDYDVRRTLVLVKEGTINAGTIFKNTNSSTIVIDTTALTYANAFAPTAPTLEDSISALGGGQGGAYSLTAQDNIVVTCSTSLYGVKLPDTFAVNTRCRVVNNGAKILALYPATGNTIDSLSANTPIPVLPGNYVELVATTANSAWKLMSGKIQKTQRPVLTVTGNNNWSTISNASYVAIEAETLTSRMWAVIDVVGSHDSTSSLTLSFSSLVFKNTTNRRATVTGAGVIAGRRTFTDITPNTSSMYVEFDGAGETSTALNGTLELESQSLI